jgi:CubicO group peptidase (beta-lactamase class C family)
MKSKARAVVAAFVGMSCAPAPDGAEALSTAQSSAPLTLTTIQPALVEWVGPQSLAVEADPPPPETFDDFQGFGEPQDNPSDFKNEGSGLLDYEFGFMQTRFHWAPSHSESQIQDTLNLGYRVHDVEVVSLSPLRFNVVYVKNEGPYQRDSLWKYDTTSTVLEHLVDNENYRVTKLKPRQVGTALRFSAVLEKNTGDNFKNFRWWWDSSWQGLIDDFAQNDHRPVDMEAYAVDGQTRWAGVAIENAGKDEREWLPVTGGDLQLVEEIAKFVTGARFTDLETNGSDYYGILTEGMVESGLNHWTHAYVPESKVVHLIRRHGARIISIQKTSIVGGDNDLENGYHVTLVDNETPETGIAREGFGGIDAAMIRSLKLGEIPGGALAIVRGGKLIYARGYGYSNVEAAELATADTMFRMGSISKTMTGMSAMKLVEQGALTPHGTPLTLDTKVFQDVIFPALEGANNVGPHLSYPHLLNITLRHVLTHTAGWYEQQETWGLDVTPFAGSLPLNNTLQIAKDLGIEHTPDCSEIVPYYYGEPLDSEPGDNVFYSGLGICVAALVVEIISGQHYGQFFADEFIDPLSLNAGKTRFGYSSDYLSAKHATEARYYHDFGAARVSPRLIEMADDFAEDGTPLFSTLVDPPYGTMPMRSIWSAGSWAASPVAMVRLATALQRSRRPYGPLAHATFMDFFDSYAANLNGSWGGGAFKTNGTDTLEHGGALTGGFGFYRVHNQDYAGSPDLSFAFFFNATPKDGVYGDSIERVKSAINDALAAINAADWDLFEEHGFAEPPPASSVPRGGTGELSSAAPRNALDDSRRAADRLTSR